MQMTFYTVWQRSAKDIVGGFIVSIITVLLRNMKKLTPPSTLKCGGEY